MMVCSKWATRDLIERCCCHVASSALGNDAGILGDAMAMAGPSAVLSPMRERPSETKQQQGSRRNRQQHDSVTLAADEVAIRTERRPEECVR